MQSVWLTLVFADSDALQRHSMAIHGYWNRFIPIFVDLICQCLGLLNARNMNVLIVRGADNRYATLHPDARDFPLVGFDRESTYFIPKEYFTRCCADSDWVAVHSDSWDGSQRVMVVLHVKYLPHAQVVILINYPKSWAASSFSTINCGLWWRWDWDCFSRVIVALVIILIFLDHN